MDVVVRPGSRAWVSSGGLLGALCGLAAGWYASLGLVLVRTRGAGWPPPDLLERMSTGWDTTALLLGLPVLGAAGMAAAARAAAAGPATRPRRRWTAWLGLAGAAAGLVAALGVTVLWSLGSLSFDGSPPTVARQARGVAVFGLIPLLPAVVASAGAGLGWLVGGRRPGHRPAGA